MCCCANSSITFTKATHVDLLMLTNVGEPSLHNECCVWPASFVRCTDVCAWLWRCDQYKVSVLIGLHWLWCLEWNLCMSNLHEWRCMLTCVQLILWLCGGVAHIWCVLWFCCLEGNLCMSTLHEWRCWLVSKWYCDCVEVWPINNVGCGCAVLKEAHVWALCMNGGIDLCPIDIVIVWRCGPQIVCDVIVLSWKRPMSEQSACLEVLTWVNVIMWEEDSPTMCPCWKVMNVWMCINFFHWLCFKKVKLCMSNLHVWRCWLVCDWDFLSEAHRARIMCMWMVCVCEGGMKRVILSEAHRARIMCMWIWCVCEGGMKRVC